jgi:small subunit ribosomal protein S1
MSENNSEMLNTEESFEELLEKSLNAAERLKPGQKVSAEIVGITGESVYIDLGGKTEGIIDIDEFRKEDGTLSVSVGDKIEAWFF